MSGAPRIYKYKAFISYRHQDEAQAVAMQEFLEKFRLPVKLCKQHPDRPKRLGNIFRDATDLPPAELKQAISKALAVSEYLIVLCSQWTNQPNKEGRRWVPEEVDDFLSLNEQNKYKVIPVLLPREDVSVDKEYIPKSLVALDILATDMAKKEPKACYYDVVASLLNLDPVDLRNRAEEVERKQRFRKKLLTWSFSLMGLFGGLFAWDFCVPKVSYYRDYVERYNLPVGIEPLTEEEVKKKDFVYKFTEQWYRLRQVECCDSLGNLRERNTFDGVDKSVKMKFTYREGRSIEEGGLEKTEHYNKMGGLIKWYDYDEGMKTIRFQSVDKEVEPVDVNFITLQQDNPYTLNDDVPMVNVTRDEKGFVNERRYRDGKNKPLSVEGVYGVRFERDEVGRITKKRYLDKSGDVVNNVFGVAGISIEYDKLNGNEDETENVISFVDAEDKLAFHSKYQMAYVKDTMKDGGLIKREFFDESCAPCYSFLGYQVAEYEYSDDNKWCVERYYGADKEGYMCPCYDNEGVAGKRYEYNEDEGVSRLFYLAKGSAMCSDRNGITMVRTKKEQREGYEVHIQSFHRYNENNGKCFVYHPSWGIPIVEHYYNSNGLLVKQVYKNEKNERCLNTNKIAEVRFEYDDTNRRLLKETYYGVVENERCLNVVGVAGYKYVYNDLADSIEILTICLDTKDNPCVDRVQIVENRCIIDQLDKIKELSYYELNEKKTRLGGLDGYHKVVYNYNDKGQLIKETFYDADGKLCKNKDGFAKKTYDRQDKLERIRYYNENRQPCFDKYEVAGFNREYNKRGLIEKVTYVGTTGLPSPCKDGFVSVVYEYNARGLKIKESYFDKDSNRCVNTDGFAGLSFEYDELSDKLKAIHYLYKDEKSCADNDAVGKKVIIYDDLRIKEIGWEEYDSNNKLIRRSDEYLIGSTWRDVKATLIYSEEGNIIGERYYDLENNPCVHPIGGQAETRMEYKNGKASRVWYIGVDGKPCSNMLGHAYGTLEYNEAGQVSRVQYLGIDNKLCRIKSGYAEIRYEYDSQGNKTKESYYDEKGNCVNTIDFPK